MLFLKSDLICIWDKSGLISSNSYLLWPKTRFSPQIDRSAQKHLEQCRIGFVQNSILVFPVARRSSWSLFSACGSYFGVRRIFGVRLSATRKQDADCVAHSSSPPSIDMLLMLKNGYNRSPSSARFASMENRFQRLHFVRNEHHTKIVQERGGKKHRNATLENYSGSHPNARLQANTSSYARSFSVVLAVWICSKTFYLNCQTGFCFLFSRS